MKNLKVSKAAIALSTAVLMTGNIIGPVASASVANKLSLTPNTFDIKPGERLSLSVDYSPSDSGVAGFTISVHFDPQSMDVYVPDEDMSAGSAFALVSNYDNAGSGVITLVGANMAGTNVTEKSNITTLYFDIKDNAEGYLSYWVDVENMVADGSSGYVNADYSAPTESSPLRVGVASKYAETTTTTTTTAAVTEKKEESEKAATTTKAVTTTAAPEEKEEELVELLPEEPEEGEEPKEEKPAVTTTAKAEEKPEDTSAAKEETKPEQEKKEETKQEPEEKAEDKPEENGEALYSYTQDGGDFNSESTVQYVFNLSDYTDDLSGTADIKVNLNTSGSVSGALGFGTNEGEWDSYGNRSDGNSETVWEAKDVDLSSLNGYAAVQFYYIENGTDISVEDISIEVNKGDEINAEPEEAAAEEAAPVEDTASDEQEANDETALAEETPAAEDNGDEDEAAPEEDETADTDTEDTDETADEEDDTPYTEEDAEEDDTAAEDDEETLEEAVPASIEVKPATTEVQNKVVSAAAQASANPKTGDSSTTEKVRLMLMLISSGVLVYSAIAVLLNKLVFGKKRS